MSESPAEDDRYALWLRCGAKAAAFVTLGTAYVGSQDVSAYLTDVQVLIADMEPTELALTAAWLGKLGAESLIASHAGDVENALDEVRAMALQIAVSETSE